MRVLVDTNFLFSFLRLHDNPSNEVAADLIELIERAKDSVQVELCVLPITVDETRRVLRATMIKLAGLIPRAKLALAAREMNSAGLVTRYLQAAANDPSGRLTPESFFGPYESDLVGVLRERSVSLLDVDLDSLRMDQEVIDDMHDQEIVQKKGARRGPKPYEANLHDMVLWHYAERARPSVGNSPIDLDIWVCTVDFGLVTFDRRKRRGTGQPPVCVSPSTLIQLLQFWIPRSDELDKALVGAIREPLLFLDFDTSTEQATIRILRTLSRFEEIDDLSVPTLYGVLTNDVLRARLMESPGPSSSEEVALVEAAVIKETHRLEAEVIALHKERAADAEQAHQALDSRDREAIDLRNQLKDREDEAARLASKIDVIKREYTEEKEVNVGIVETLRSEQSQLRERMRGLEEAALRSTQRRKDRRTVAGLMVCATLLLGGTAIALALILQDHVSGGVWVARVGSGVAAILGWLLILDWLVQSKQSLRDGAGHNLLVRTRKGLIALLVAVLASVFASAVYDAVR